MSNWLLEVETIDFYLLHSLSKDRWEHIKEMGVLISR